MNQTDLAKCFELLELPESSTWPEIKNSYFNLKKLYSNPSLAIASINEDMLDERAEEIVTQIEKAYRKLEKHFRKLKTDNNIQIELLTAKIETFDGASLKSIREELKVDLLDIAMASNIQINHLKNIESENYKDLPKDVYLRGYLTSYAEYLSLDPPRIVDDYMHQYREWRKTPREKEKVSLSMKKILPSWLRRKKNK